MLDTNNPHTLLSIADMARHFSLPESSIRYYCKRFEPFFSSVGEGRKRRFHLQAIDIIKTILEQMPKIRTAKAVEIHLAAHYPQTISADVTHSSNTTEALSDNPQNTFPTNTHFAQHPYDLALPAETNQEENSLQNLAMHILDKQTRALDTIATSLDALVKRQESIDALAERAEKAEDEAQSLRKELKVLRLLLDTNEKTQQADLDQIRTWVAKILHKNTN